MSPRRATSRPHLSVSGAPPLAPGRDVFFIFCLHLIVARAPCPRLKRQQERRYAKQRMAAVAANRWGSLPSSQRVWLFPMCPPPMLYQDRPSCHGGAAGEVCGAVPLLHRDAVPSQVHTRPLQLGLKALPRAPLSSAAPARGARCSLAPRARRIQVPCRPLRPPTRSASIPGLLRPGPAGVARPERGFRLHARPRQPGVPD